MHRVTSPGSPPCAENLGHPCRRPRISTFQACRTAQHMSVRGSPIETVSAFLAQRADLRECRLILVVREIVR